MYIELGLLTVAAYLLGSVPSAYLAAKLYRGINLKEFGSGNAGAGNLLKATGNKKLAAVVIVWDLVKGTLMVWIARLTGLDTAQQVLVGLAAIVGHNWSVFLRFDAGRGVLTTLGVAFFLMPWGVPVFVAVGLFTLVNMASALPVMAAIAALPLASWLLNYPPVITLGLLAMWLLLVIRRLTAPRTSNVPFSRDMLLNRFLFDRDIREGKAWVTRKIEKKPGAKDSKKAV